MRKLKQLPVGQLVFFTFGTLCVILVFIGGLFFLSLRSIERSNRLQQSRALNKLVLIDATAQEVGQMQAEALRQVLASDLGEIKRLEQAVRTIEKTNARELADYQKFVDTEKEKQLYERVMQARKAYWEQTQPVLALGLTNRDAEATEWFISRQAPAYDEYLKAINELTGYVETSAGETAQATARFISKTRVIGDALAGLAIIIALGTGFAVAGIARRLKQDNRVLQIEVTGRKRIEEALQRQQTELRVLFDLMPAMILFKDTENGIMRANKRAAENAGKSVGEIEGKPTREVFPQDAARCYADDLEVIHSGTPKLGSVHTVRDREGKELWIQTDRVPYCDKDGKVIGIVVMAQDITERKRLEDQLFQSQKMETVGKLAGGVAHEFNNIMTIIIGQSELLLLELLPGNPLCKNATEIRKAAGRAATLTRQLLAYGRKQTLHPEILNLNSFLAGMEGTLRHLMGRGVDMRIAPTAGLKTVKADAVQIEQVIMNIAMNAADAMPDGGKLTLETANVRLDQERVSRFPGLKAGEYVLLAITDTGTGMSEEVKARVFEPFFTTKGVGEGTGLGLSTCYGIIKQSGGLISVYSEPGHGTTFEIYLPQVEAQTKIPLEFPDSPDLPRGTESILLVEDDPALREMAATLLRRLGYTVLAAANGIEALRLKQQRDTGPLDLLFTDVVMPHMNGKELAGRIRALYPQTRILFTSASTENAIGQQGGLDEGVALLQKPFTPSALAHKLREVLDQPGAPEPDTAQKKFSFAESSAEPKTPGN